MQRTFSRRPMLERLETRDAPSGLPETPLTTPPPPPPTVIDPTLNPSNPSSTSTAVQVTAVSEVFTGGSRHITVTGLQAANLQQNPSLTFRFDGQDYVISLYATNQDGSYTLTVEGATNLNVQAGDNAVVISGNGGNTPAPTTPPTPTPPPIIDPTLNPTGP